MPAIKYRVTLTDDEVEMLEAMLRKGKCAARKQTRARILLKAAAGCKDAEIIEALAVSATMIHHTRQRCVEAGPPHSECIADKRRKRMFAPAANLLSTMDALIYSPTAGPKPPDLRTSAH